MLSLPIVDSPMGVDLFESAVALYRTARRAGVTVRSSIDCLIAASALRHDLEILHRDRDYPMLARVSPLRHRAL
jgi:predicted nucleic acid-binding protein